MDEISKAEYSGSGPGGMPTEKTFLNCRPLNSMHVFHSFIEPLTQ